MKSSYVSIKNFAPNVYKSSLGDNEPLTYCLVDTMDKSFQHGGTANLYGPRSEKCQAYMSERCAKNWDGFCEYAYKEQGVHKQWPFNQYWPNNLLNRIFGTAYNVPASTGEQLLQNTAMRKYCTLPTCQKRCEPFDPLVPNSPTITLYDSYETDQGCFPVCRVEPTNIDNDPVMNRMLAKPELCAPVLINICNTSQREGTNLGNTKLGKFCKAYRENLSKLQ